MNLRPDTRAQLRFRDARLFAQLTERCFLGRLARFHGATRRDPHIALAHVSTEQQHPILLVDKEHAGGGTEDGSVLDHSRF